MGDGGGRLAREGRGVRRYQGSRFTQVLQTVNKFLTRELDPARILLASFFFFLYKDILKMPAIL